MKVCIRVFAAFFLLLMTLAFGCPPETGCNEASTFILGKEEGHFEYGNWSISVGTGALSGPTRFSVALCPGIPLDQKTTIGLQDTKTGAVEIWSVPMQTANGYETIRVEILDPQNIVNKDAIGICANPIPTLNIRSLVVTTRDSTGDRLATVDPTTTPEEKCYPLIQDPDPTQVSYFSGADVAWASVWSKLESLSKKIYDTISAKLTSGQAILMDPCATCTWAGTKIAQNFSCEGLVGKSLCNAVTTILQVSAPVLLIPGVKQVMCTVANAALQAINRAITGGTLGDTCNKLTAGGNSAFKDLVTCDWHYACHYIALCTVDADQTSLVLGIKQDCKETCDLSSSGSECCSDPSSCYESNCGLITTESKCATFENCVWDSSTTKCISIAQQACSGVTSSTDCGSTPACPWSNNACRVNCASFRDAKSCTDSVVCSWSSGGICNFSQ